jgi:hypothetical protein
VSGILLQQQKVVLGGGSFPEDPEAPGQEPGVERSFPGLTLWLSTEEGGKGPLILWFCCGRSSGSLVAFSYIFLP